MVLPLPLLLPLRLLLLLPLVRLPDELLRLRLDELPLPLRLEEPLLRPDELRLRDDELERFDELLERAFDPVERRLELPELLDPLLREPLEPLRDRERCCEPPLEP